MDHLRVDPKMRRMPRPKRAGWAAREVFLFLLQVSADYDLRGRFPPSMQDLEWLADEWACGDSGSLPTIRGLLEAGIPAAIAEDLLHLDQQELVISAWDEFYNSSKTGAERQRSFREKRRADQGTGPTVTGVTGVTEVTEVTEPVTCNASNAGNESNATTQHYTALHNTEETKIRRADARLEAVVLTAVTSEPASNTPPIADARAVFEHWQQVHKKPKAVLDAKRDGLIRARLKTYSVEQLKLAVDGCKASRWHQGENDKGRIYADISLICRDSEHVEQFLEIAEKTGPPKAKKRIEWTVDEWGQPLDPPPKSQESA